MNKLKLLFNRVRESKDGKVLVENFAYLSLLQVAGYIFPLLTMPYLARVIGVEGFGKIAFASAVIVWIQTIADWGFNYTATRDVAKCRDNKSEVERIFSNVLWARVFLMVVSFVILCLLVVIVPKFRVNALILFLSFLLIPGHILFPDWFFQAIERMKYITILNVLSKFIFTIAIFLFVKDKNDYILQPLLTSLGFIVSGFIALFIILKKWRYKIQWYSFRDVFLTIKKSTDVFIQNIFPNLYNSFSMVLLGFFCGSSANGILDAGNRFVSIFQQFMQIVSRTFFPFLSRKINTHTLYAKFSIIISILFSVISFLFAPLLISLFFTSEFESSILVMQIMSLSIFFLTLGSVYGQNYMIIEGYERNLRNITMVVSIIGFCISFPLIYFWSYIGAALTIVLTRALLGISCFIFVKRIILNCSIK